MVIIGHDFRDRVRKLLRVLDLRDDYSMSNDLNDGTQGGAGAHPPSPV
jgi:hypothetical protein